MKAKFFSVTSLLIFAAVVCFAVAADLTGKWTGVIKAPDGNEYPLVYVFKADGNNLSGSLQGPQGEIPITEGKVNGNDFSFKLDFNGMPITNTGKYYVDSVAIDAEVSGTKIHSVLKRAAN
jgi:hypothetical protein